ncbi:hypothetical protein LTR53_003312 [Teratosphaeriaceae sp. CCFEE 6253]|nr:hypothetical protein LTR53_003312 [Teratosphaeriaceae sp. CCFEE 6253]
MRALRYYGKGDIRLEDVPAPACAPDEVRVKVAYCGICGSDLHEYTGGPIFPPAPGERNPYTGVELPVIMGHEMCGTIAELGAGVTGFSVGQNVAVIPAMDDRHHGYAQCRSCLAGRPNICKRTTYYGLNANGGGFSEEICVKTFALVVLPEDVPLRRAGLVEPLAVAWHMIRISGYQPNDTVAVIGAGPIGCALTFLLKAQGARAVIVSEISPARSQQAAVSGADRVVNPLGAAPGAQDPVLTAVQEFAEDGVDVAFDACGLQATLVTAIACTRPGGVVFNVAIHDKPLSVDLMSLTLTEKKLMGGICYTREDFEAVVEVLSKTGEEAEKLITSVVPLEQVIEGGFLELINNTASHVKILIKV